MVARIKTILTDNQKKTDYKPEMIVVTNYTQVNFKVWYTLNTIVWLKKKFFFFYLQKLHIFIYI